MRKYIWHKAEDRLEEVTDIMKWAEFMETSMDNRRVAMDEVGVYVVYTSFLGIDHNFGATGDDPPLVFETMATKSGEWQDWQRRFFCSKDALAFHQSVVEMIRQGRLPEDEL